MLHLILAAAPAPAAPPPAAAPPAPSAAPIRSVTSAQLLEQRADGVLKVLKGELPANQVFTPEFLAQVPPDALAKTQQQFVAGYGALSGAKVTPAKLFHADIVLRFARAEGHGVLALSPKAPHLVAGLQMTRFEPVNDSAAALAKDIAALPGSANAWFGPLAGGPPRLTVNAERPMALGSTFKLFVLAALQRAIDEKRLSWSQVVPLSVRSYPSGLTQDWAPGTPVTVQTLATLMLQVSDNTATDQLIELLGRDAVERVFTDAGGPPTPTLPFLGTREMFAIKSDPALRTRYAAADEAGRRALLAILPREGPPLDTVAKVFAGSPLAIDRIEWFAPPTVLRKVLQGFTGPGGATARAVLGAAKGMSAVEAAKWDYVGYKGGSEPGVLNLTWLLRDKAGVWHMATIGWNDPAAPVNQARLVGLATRMLALTE